MYRMWAAVQAITLVIVATTAVLFAFVRPSSCSEMCDLELEVKLFIATVTVGLAAAGAWTVTEMCVSSLGSVSYRATDIDVRPGQTATVPGLCPTG